MDYLLHVLIVAALFATLSSSLNLLSGYTGLLSMAHAGLFGLGAYVAADMLTHGITPLLEVLCLAAAASSVLSLVISIPALRVRSDYFAIVSFAVQMILFGLFNNLDALTGGALGIAGIEQPTLFGWRIDTKIDYLLVSVAILMLSAVVVARIAHSPYGRVLRAIRDDEVFAASVGKNIRYFKISACALSAAMAGVVGALYAPYISYIDPTGFTVNESILILSMVILGGSATVLGPIIGAVILVMLPEVARFIGLPTEAGAHLRQILYGTALIAMIWFRPGGLVGVSGRMRKADAAL